jgi:serine/threonine-protein phosphatase 6 regulatory ankyrin repeat subunit B
MDDIEIARAIRRGTVTIDIMIKMMRARHPLFSSCLGTYDFTLCEPDGRTLLIASIYDNDTHAALQIIEKDTNIDAVYCGKTALEFAIDRENNDIVRALIQKPATVTFRIFKYARSMGAEHPLLIELFNAIQDVSCICWLSMCVSACIENQIDFIQGIEIPNYNIQDARGNTLLMYVSKHRDCGLLDYILSKNVDVNMQNAEGDTALIYAVEHNNVHAVESLLNAGANKNIANSFGETAISIAQINNHADILQLLNP